MTRPGVFAGGLLAFAFCLSAISGCAPALRDMRQDGSLFIVPETSLDIATYDIGLTCPGQPTVTLNGISVSTTRIQPVVLRPGSWTVTIGAMNASGDIIGVGSSTVSVSAGGTATATIAVLSLSGAGTLILTADLSALQISAPSLTGSLTPAGAGTPISVGFTIGAGTATYSDTVAAGCYQLQLDLSDGTQKLARYVDTLLVAADSATVGSLSAKPEDGSVKVKLVDQITRAIPITLRGAQPALGLGATMTVAAVTNGVGVSSCSYQWYLDGVEISGATKHSVTVGDGLDVGNYTLTVVVESSSVDSSQSVDFAVMPASTTN